MKEDKIPGPPNPPQCRHGVFYRICQECKKDNVKIKELVDPLINEYWENKGKDDLYHIVFRAYHMGMRNDHKTHIETENHERKNRKNNK